MKIDLVYLWCDGSDNEFQIIKNKYLGFTNEKNYNGSDECRYRENSELKFSLRSVSENLPWINKIYIVTNGQIPSWLDVTNDKVKIVTHSEIMPSDCLPTFNSEAIESCIPNIPGLSEYFIYANDDFFVNKILSKNYFFDKNGNPIIRLKPQKWTENQIESSLYMNNISSVLNVAKIKYNFNLNVEPTHNMDAYRKSYFAECIKTYNDEFKKVRHQRFRSENFAHRFLVSLYMICEKGCSYKLHKTKRQQRDNLCISLCKCANLLNMLKKFNPSLFCVNDDEISLGIHHKILKSNLCKRYSTKQSWENSLDVEIEPISEDAITLVFAPDDNYFKYFAVCLQSIINNSSSEEIYDIVVFDSDISDDNKSLLAKMVPNNFIIRYFDIKDYIEEYHSDIEFKTLKYWSISMYYRCFIPILMKGYKRVLYMDVDICVNKNLSEFFNIDFDKKEVVVVLDTISPIISMHPSRQHHFVNDLELKSPETYFNSGVILFNNTLISRQKYFAKFKELLESKNLLFPDQDILNIIFEDSKKLVSCKYNFQAGAVICDKGYVNKIKDSYKVDYLKSLENPVIIHYTSSRKPWIFPFELSADIFWEYARKTPFYEDIIYSNLQKNQVSRQELQNILIKRKIFFNYYIAKIMSNFTFGKLKNHFSGKKFALKRRIREIRALSKI